MFRGTYFHTVDDKGRVAVPRKFREALAGAGGDTRLVITRTLDDEARSLDVHTHAEWERLEAKIDTLPRFSAATRVFKRRYLHPAQDLSIDSQGRILLPTDLRGYAGLDGAGKEAVFTGENGKFLLWSKPEWERVNKNDEEVGIPADLFEKIDI